MVEVLPALAEIIKLLPTATVPPNVDVADALAYIVVPINKESLTVKLNEELTVVIVLLPAK